MRKLQMPSFSNLFDLIRKPLIGSPATDTGADNRRNDILSAEINAVFKAVLHRSATEDELRIRIKTVRAGTKSVDEIIQDIGKSEEAGRIRVQQISSNIAEMGLISVDLYYAEIVNLLFKTILRRAPDDAARHAFAGDLKSGKLTLDQAINELQLSKEAKQTGVPLHYHLAQLVNVIFKTSVGRGPVDADRQAWVDVLIEEVNTVDDLIADLRGSVEGRRFYNELVRPDLEGEGYISVDQHYCDIADLLYHLILRRAPDKDARYSCASDLQARRVTIEQLISQLEDSDEVRRRILSVNLPDILEGVYRALKGAPEADPQMRDLVRGALSAKTAEVIRTMVVDPSTQHYYMRPIINAQIKEFADLR